MRFKYLCTYQRLYIIFQWVKLPVKCVYLRDIEEFCKLPGFFPISVLIIGGVRHTFVVAVVFGNKFRSAMIWDFFDALPN